MKTLITSLLSLVLSGCSFSEQNTTDYSRSNNVYHISIDGIDDRVIRVVAELPLKGDELKIIQHPKRFFPDIDSWWDIIEIHSVTDSFGKSLDHEITSNTRLKLSQKVIGTVKVEYSIDISYIDRSYPNLNTAIGKSFENGFFVVGKPLFIFGSWELETIVNILKPDGLEITVPWKQDKKAYEAKSLRELVLSNVIISENSVGVNDFKVGGLSYGMAAFSMDDEHLQLINEMAKNISAYYVKTFPLEEPVRYVQLVYGVPVFRNGGEAYPYSSASAISKSNLNASYFWKITIFHELFHMWNSHLLKGVPTNSNLEWLTEGFTDYITETVLFENGYLTKNELAALQSGRINKLQDSFIRSDESILSSGENKGQNYNIVYEGGWLVAHWLNGELMSRTKGQWHTIRLLNHLFEKYPRDGENDLTVKALVSDVGAINSDLSKDLELMLNSKDWSVIEAYIK